MKGSLEIKESDEDRLKKAIKAGDIQQVQALLAGSPKLLDAVINDGETALHLAAKYGHEKVAELLIAKSPKLLDAVTTYGYTVLHWASRIGHEKIAELLIAKSPKLLDVVTNKGETALHLAAEKGHEGVVKMLITINPKLINAVDEDRSTALNYAAVGCHNKVVDILFSGMDLESIDATKDGYGMNLLHWAAYCGLEEVIGRLMIKNPKLINTISSGNGSALGNAAIMGHEKVVEMLFSRMNTEAINATDCQGMTALHRAANNGYVKIVEILLPKMDLEIINATDDKGSTALHSATANGHEKVVELLLARSPGLIDITDNNGYTALHLAAYNDQEKMVKLLIAKNPNLIDAVDNNNHTPLHLAAENGNEKVVQILSKAMHVLALQRKNLKIEENKTANKVDQDSKKLHYSQEKIHNLLSRQLANDKNVSVEVLDLSSPTKNTLSEEQLKAFVNTAIKGNQCLAIALHLHGKAWASLVIKHIGGDNLQLIYNDPTGNAFNKEAAVRELISSLTEQNQDGDTTTTDLRKNQQNIESDSGAIVVDNLVKLTTAKSLKKADLTKLLLEAGQVNDLKIKHLLLEETEPSYSKYKLAKLLELSLKGKPIIMAPVTSFEDKALLTENIKVSVKQIMDTGVPIIIPLSTQGKYWSGLVMKNQGDGSLQIIYINPTGDPLKEEKNSIGLIKAIMDLNSDVHIIDLKYKQTDDKHVSGCLTVSNLIKLALSETSDFRMKDFQKILSTSESIDQLRQQHDKLIHDYVMPNLIPEVDPSILGLREEREPYERKGERSEGKEEYIAPPSYDEEDNPVQMHVLGDASANHGEHTDSM